MEFEYDIEKSKANKQKHGIDFEEAQQLWNDDDMLMRVGITTNEIRCLNIGMINGKMWTAVTTNRDKIIRIISVRRSRKSEEIAYENKYD